MPQSSPSNSNKDTYMVYRVGGHLYAAPISSVIEVILTESLISLPDASTYVAGIVHFRGKVIPVIDTVKRLALPFNGDNSYSYIVVFAVEVDGINRTFGALVSKVLSVGDYSRADIRDVDVMPSDIGSPSYIKGVIEHDNEYIIVVLPAKFISNEDYSNINNNVSEN